MRDPAAIEAGLRAMGWKERTHTLKTSVQKHHPAVEIPALIRGWLELNRDEAPTDEARAIIEGMKREAPEGWLGERSETIPISGWVVTATHFLVDGARWWLFSAQRHDDTSPLLGPIVPAAANKVDLHRLHKIIKFAGGDPMRELMRTGAITIEDRQELLAAGKPDIAEYGRIFYWWKA